MASSLAMASKKRKKEPKDESDYKHEPAPQSGREWREWRQKRKDMSRKWKEEKLIKSLEKAKRAAEVSANVSEEQLVNGGSASTRCTLTIALPGSVLDVAPSAELRTCLAGQLARAMAVFSVDEIVVYDDGRTLTRNESGEVCPVAVPASSGKHQNYCMLLAKILLYLECPLYLRKALFPPQSELQYAGMLSPLFIPHHLQASDESRYREGIVLNKPVKPGKGSFVNIGLNKECQIDKCLQAGVRVTVEISDSSNADKRVLKGKAVSPSSPLLNCGLYWGYQVRVATSLSRVFSECPYDGGYDVKLAATTAVIDDGKGQPLEDLELPASRHYIVVFSGTGGFTHAMENDDDVSDAEMSLFDAVVDPYPNKGCKMLRIEEAILVLLSTLRPRLRTKAGA